MNRRKPRAIAQPYPWGAVGGAWYEDPRPPPLAPARPRRVPIRRRIRTWRTRRALLRALRETRQTLYAISLGEDERRAHAEHVRVALEAVRASWERWRALEDDRIAALRELSYRVASREAKPP
jgi:DNA-binding IclR family transcriptional regulator